MTKPLLLDFHDISNKPQEDGLKHVLFKLHDGERMIGLDWGYAESKDGVFENLQQGNITAMVVKWCRMPNPQVVL